MILLVMIIGMAMENVESVVVQENVNIVVAWAINRNDVL